jgi:Tol biopolymer transport system component
VLDLASRTDSNLFKVDLDGGKELEITSGVVLNLWPTVSPDGKMIAYQTTNAIGKLFSSSILIKPASGGQQRQLAADGFNAIWSHEAHQLAFLRFSGGYVNIFLLTDAGAEKQLTTGGILYSGHSLLPTNRISKDFSWSSDGSSKIAYCSRNSGQLNVWTINADGSNEAQITRNTDPNLSLSSPVWSRDGKSIAYVSNMSLPGAGKQTWSVWLAER